MFAAVSFSIFTLYTKMHLKELASFWEEEKERIHFCC
jgi:hypothetical protein